MSSLPVESLPILATDRGCQRVVTVEYKLTENDMKLKNRQLWKLKKKYYRAEFFFVVMLGPADLKFQIQGKNGVLSSGHDSLKVDFVDSTEPLSATAPPRSTAAQHTFDGILGNNGNARRPVRYA